MLKRTIISASLILASSLGINAAEPNTKEEVNELVEQEFQAIDLDAGEVNEEDSDGKFEFVDQNAQASKTKQISIKNEFFESVKVVLSSDDEKASVANKEIYLNAYETNDSVTISKGIQYEVEVYNLYNQYLGHIYKANTKSKSKIAISPFLLIKDKPIKKKQEPELVNKKVEKQEETKAQEIVAEPIQEKVAEVKKEEKAPEKKVEVKEAAKEEVATKKEAEVKPEDASSGFKSIKESSNYSHEIITHKETEETKIFRETETKKEEVASIESNEETPVKAEEKKAEVEAEAPSPKDITITKPSSTAINKAPASPSAASKLRSIKVANISDNEIHINLVDPLGNPIGGGWTISNDVYVPQFLNFKSEPVHIEPNVKLLINNSQSKEIVTKYAKDLNIDEKGNYVWFVD